MSEQPLNVPARPDLPGGTVALLFTDIEGSTALVQALGQAYPAHLEAHRRIMRDSFAAHGGIEVGNQGDSFFAVFRSVPEAVGAVVQAQRGLQAFDWPPGHPLRVRMGLHCGEPTPILEGYVGVDLNRTARLMSAGHGGQVLLSEAAAMRAGDLPPGCELRDRGEHRLKDLPRPEHIFELCIGGLPCEFPPLRTLPDLLHNLPSHLPPILGREREVEAVRSLLRSGVGLATLLGPGGTGKTRLALEIAARTSALWPDGVFFVPLAPVAPPDAPPNAPSSGGPSSAGVEDAIASAITRELGLRDEAAQGAAEVLLEHLKARRMLLVLDNFEHLVDGAAIVARCMARCPHLQILATSRVPLHVNGEQEVPIAPLALPQRKPLPPVAALSQYAAVELFVARARAVRPGFELSEENAGAIAEVCARLDGLPLAIELAAARVKLLPPAAMLARLEKGLSFLVGGAREVAARHQTLRATIRWSYDLLGEDEKRLFRRLGVFRGGFSFESAEQVCAAPLLDSEEPLEVFEGISVLLNQSLLVVRDEVDGQSRFGMLETIREFALEELDACGEGDAMRERHLGWCCDEAVRRAAQMRHEPGRSLRLFEAEADNWRAAWAWSLGARPQSALRLAAETALLWNRIGATSEHYERLEAALRAAPHGDVKHRCRVLHYLTQADRNRGDWARYGVRLQHLESLAREAGLPEFQAIALDQRMWDAVREGRLEAALEHSASVVELWRECVELAQSQEAGEGEVERCEFERNDAMILQVEILTKAGRLDEAYALMEESLAFKRASHDESGLTWGLYKYAQLLANIGRFAEARQISEEVVRRAEESGIRGAELGWYRHDAALMALREGDLARAREHLRASFSVFEKNAAAGGFLLLLHALPYLLAQEGNWPLVARALGAGDALRGAPYPDDWEAILQAQEAAARVALGDPEFELLRAAGTRLSPQRALEEVLGSPS